MLLPKTIEFDRSADFHRMVRRNHFSRTIGLLRWDLLPVGMVGIIGILCKWHKGQTGGAFWILVGIAICPFLIWLLYYWATSQIQSRGVPPHVKVFIDVDSFSVTTEKGISKIEWSSIKTLWRFQDLILLFWEKRNDLNHGFAIPKQALTEGLEPFIEQKVRENGGKVK